MQSTLHEQAVDLAQALDRSGPRELGKRYSCAVLPGGVERATRVAVLVPRAADRAAARRLLRRQARRLNVSARNATVRVGEERRRHADLLRIARRMNHHIRGQRGAGAIFGIGTVRCPRVQIAVGSHPPKPFWRWAREQVRRYGRDRVLIMRGTVVGTPD